MAALYRLSPSVRVGKWNYGYTKEACSYFMEDRRRLVVIRYVVIYENKTI